MNSISPGSQITGDDSPLAGLIGRRLGHECFLQRTLEIGCGTGSFARFFSPGLYTGIDNSLAKVAIARHRNPERDFRVTYPGEQFHGYDAAVACDIMHRLSMEDLAVVVASLLVPRFLIAEFLNDREVTFYGREMGPAGYGLRRGYIIPSEYGDIALMDFHRKD